MRLFIKNPGSHLARIHPYEEEAISIVCLGKLKRTCFMCVTTMGTEAKEIDVTVLCKEMRQQLRGEGLAKGKFARYEVLYTMALNRVA
eukprot:6213091-Pleurochrysis_carterae.AAC.2